MNTFEVSVKITIEASDAGDADDMVRDLLDSDPAIHSYEIAGD